MHEILTDEDCLDFFNSISLLTSKMIEYDEVASNVNVDDLAYDVENEFDVYHDNYSESYLCLNMKLNYFCIDIDDIIKASPEATEIIKNNEEHESFINKTISNWIESNDQFYDYIEYSRENFFYDISEERIKYSIDYYNNEIDRLIENGNFNDAKEYSLIVLQYTVLLESIEFVSPEKTFCGRQGGYYAPVKSDYFESFIDDISNDKDDVINTIKEIKDELLDLGVVCKKNKNNDLVLVKDKKEILLNSNDNKDILSFIRDIVSNEDFDEDNFKFFCKDSESYLDNFNDYANDLDSSVKDFKDNFNALKVLFETAKDCYDSVNKKEKYVCFLVDSCNFSTFINEELESHIIDIEDENKLIPKVKL